MIAYRKTIDWWDWLLIAGAVLAPMTGLRLWKIGPAELLCFIWSFRYMNRRIRFGFLLKFFFVFLASMFIGTLICMQVAPVEVRMDSWPTWVFLSVISCMLYSQIKRRNVEYNIKVFQTICKAATLWYFALYLYSMTVSRSFFGAPLWYYNRYSGGGTNPHQIAVLVCGISFWYLYAFSKTKKIHNLFLFVITVFLLHETRSSTGIAAVALSMFIYIAIWIMQTERTRKRKVALLLLEIFFVLTVAILFYRQLYTLAYEWVSDDPNGLGRFFIWSSFRQAIVKSPVFGLGPGTHGISYSGLKEFHNSYLEIFAASGIIGFTAFIVLTLQIVIIIFRGEPLLLPIITAMYGYSMAGFAFRRLAYWIVMIFTIVIAEQVCAKNKNVIGNAIDWRQSNAWGKGIEPNETGNQKVY